MTGGYSLIDCFDVNITSDPVKIEGIFKKYQMSKRKAFLLSNVTINNTQLNDVFSTPYFEAGKVCFPAYDGVIKISDTDYVTFEATADVIADKYLSKEDFLTIESDNTPYVSRTARDGLVKLSLIGATVAWNQLVQNGNFADTSGWIEAQSNATLSVANNIGTVTVTGDGSYLSQNINITKNHKCFFAIELASDILTVAKIRMYEGYSNGQYILPDTSSLGILKSIFNADNNKNRLDIRIYRNHETKAQVGDSYTIKNVQLFDLTQMFGTAIADYVYSLEQAVEGSGIAWLQSYGFFTKDYYAYDAGSLQSVCTSGRKITALDGTIRNYPIDNEELRGLFKLDANNRLVANGDVYPSSGGGTRKYIKVNLGDCNWTYNASYQFFSSDINGIYLDTAVNSSQRIICSKYSYGGYNSSTANMLTATDKSIYKRIYNEEAIYIKDTSYTDAATFKTAMDGVYLVAEAATETTFSADPYINPQRSEGTEEFVDELTRDVMIPVGNNSTYYKDELFNIIGEYIDSCDDAVIAMIPEGE